MDPTAVKIGNAQRQSRRFYDDAKEKALKTLRAKGITKHLKIYLTGHSLGGYQATYVGLVRKAEEVLVFNAPPGARYLVAKNSKEAANLDRKFRRKIKNFRIRNDVVSSFAGLDLKNKIQLGHTGRICQLAAVNPKSFEESSWSELGIDLFVTLVPPLKMVSAFNRVVYQPHRMQSLLENMSHRAPECHWAPKNKYLY